MLSTTAVPDTRWGNGDNCHNEDVSLPYELYFSQSVRYFPLCSPTLSVFDDRSSPQETPTSRVVSNTNGSTTAPVPIPLDRMEVSVHTHSEQYGESGSQASQYGLYIGADGELHEKPRPGVGVDVERAAEAEK
jgi:hypothetical protein